jgi:acyl-CoA thioesterase-1
MNIGTYNKHLLFQTIIIISSVITGCQKTFYLDTSKSISSYINIKGESFVLADTNSSNFFYDSLILGSVHVRSKYLETDSNNKIYKEGIDYKIDYTRGTIKRINNSSIPNYSKNPTYGKVDFNQNDFIDFSNHPYFVHVDYNSMKKDLLTDTISQSQYLVKFKKKLESGDTISIVSYGNSITAGGEVSTNERRFQLRWIEYLKQIYPKSKIKFQDVSIPGYSSKDGILLWDSYIGKTSPDLVLLGWGMNDANLGGATPTEYKNNLKKLVQMIKKYKQSEVIIYSCFRPNENWYYSSHSMYLFASSAKSAAVESNSAYADVFNVFEKVFTRKNQSSILGNNINHPNDYGHWLYFQAFKNIKF